MTIDQAPDHEDSIARLRRFHDKRRERSSHVEKVVRTAERPVTACRGDG
jgi:hypothetical protein